MSEKWAKKGCWKKLQLQTYSDSLSSRHYEINFPFISAFLCISILIVLRIICRKTPFSIFPYQYLNIYFAIFFVSFKIIRWILYHKRIEWIQSSLPSFHTYNGQFSAQWHRLNVSQSINWTRTYQHIEYDNNGNSNSDHYNCWQYGDYTNNVCGSGSTTGYFFAPTGCRQIAYV